jgi:hypothetical protein
MVATPSRLDVIKVVVVRDDQRSLDIYFAKTPAAAGP